MNFSSVNDLVSLTQVIENEKDKVLFLQTVGSRLYGMETTSSDYDIKLVTIPPVEYYMPHLSGHVLGLDYSFYPNSDQYNSVKKHIFMFKRDGGSEQKCELFSCDISLQFKMVFEGEYFVLLNTLFANNNSYLYKNSTFSKYEQDIINSIPSISFTFALQKIARDATEFIRVADHPKLFTRERLLKRLGQLVFVKNSLIKRSVTDHNVDYNFYRRPSDDIDVEEIKNGCSDVVNEIKNYCGNNVTKNNLEEYLKYKHVICRMLNELYGQEIFPIP